MILLDTTVLVYAVGEDHPLRHPCRLLVEALRDGRVRATTAPEVVQEFAHVRSRRRSRGDAAELAANFAHLLRPLIVIDDEDLHAGLRLFGEHDALGAFDAVLAAACMRRELTGLVSADQGFAAVAGLPHVHPALPELDSRLGLR